MRGIHMKLEIEVQNVVATAKIADSLDLDAVTLEIDGVRYDPDAFPGLVMRLGEPRCSLLLFKSGKVVCTGSKSEQMAGAGIRKAAEVLRRHGFEASEDVAPTIQNMVGTAAMEHSVRLEDAARSLPRSLYEPELFPGLICRVLDPKCTVLLFASGKMVCAGAKSYQDIVRSAQHVAGELERRGLFGRVRAAAA